MARIPAYKQMYTSLKKDIKEGKYKPGTFLPTESEMETAYHVSRTTCLLYTSKETCDNIRNQNCLLYINTRRASRIHTTTNSS